MARIALTFDDGPNTTTSMQVLDVLEKYQIPATFFVVGDNITEQTASVIIRGDKMGCEYANHSKTHPVMTELSDEQIQYEVSYTAQRLEEIIGKKPQFFRPPYFAENERMHQLIGLPFVLGIGCEDWEDSVSVDMRVEAIVSQAKDGEVILMHDMEGNTKTVEAIDRIIPILQEQGYEFVTVSALWQGRK